MQVIYKSNYEFGISAGPCSWRWNLVSTETLWYSKRRPFGRSVLGSQVGWLEFDGLVPKKSSEPDFWHRH